MLRAGFIVLVCCFIQHSLLAQESTGFITIDKESYRLYTEEKWDSLISMYKSTYSQEADYYYLRMRVGLACFHSGNYRLAARHFSHALDFNEADPLALEYLFYSLLYSGERDLALRISRMFPASLSGRISGEYTKPLEHISVEYLFSRTINDEFSSDPSGYFEDHPIGYSLTTSDYSNTSVSLSHTLARGVSLFHCFTRLNKNNYFYIKDGVYELSVDGMNAKQNQYYLSLSYATESGFILSPSFHYLDISYQTIISIGGAPSDPLITIADEKADDWVAGLGLKKTSGLFDYYLGTVYASIGPGTSLQGTLGFTCYPKGNLDLYAGSLLTGQFGLDQKNSHQHIIPEVFIGWGIMRKVWTEIYGTAGKIRNFADRNGYIIYNNPDWITAKITLNIIIPVSAKGSNLYLGSRWIKYESDYSPFGDIAANEPWTTSFNNLSFYGGVSWKF